MLAPANPEFLRRAITLAAENVVSGAKRWFLAHVIDTSRCAIISGSQRNRCGHVLHVASRRAPGGQRLGKDNVAPPVGDALHYGMKTTQWIARSIHHWQPEYRAGKFTIVHDNALGRNLVIIVCHPSKDLAHELQALERVGMQTADRKSTRLNSSHL